MSRPPSSDAPLYLITRSTEDDRYGLWRVDASTDGLVTPMPLSEDARFDRTHHLIQVGAYLLEWGPLVLEDYAPSYPYRLLPFDPSSDDPMGVESVQKGIWSKDKFFGYRVDFGNPTGGNEGYAAGSDLLLLGMNNFVLNFIPTAGRGTFHLFNFDPAPTDPNHADPLPAAWTPEGAFEVIEAGHQLLTMGNCVLDWVRDDQARDPVGSFAVWSFDPQSKMPLARPAIQEGQWDDIDASHQLVALGDFVLDWVPADRSYRLWRFDPSSATALSGPVRSGVLPAGFEPQTTATGVVPLVPEPEGKAAPGTIEFLRQRIKHVVYYMVENRSLDHVCGWLYERGDKNVRFVGRDGPYDGASTDFSNVDPSTGEPVHLSKYQDGKLSEDYLLELLSQDPYHDNSDVLRQLFSTDRDGYSKRAVPDMGGFVWNNGTPQVMETYSPEQLPVLNGLAREFGISDRWFCSMPGGTDVNRAFSLTGSALGKLNNFQNGTEYEDWPDQPHRPSVFKTLWSHGITDWKIYNAVEWMDFVFTDHLFLQGQIPTVDKNRSSYIASVDQFQADAAAGTLPAFSFVEPIWISLDGTSSYHPGGDLVPGEVQLNAIYDALRSGPNWDETLLVVTFDEHGGIFDHVPPPYATKPWPHDVADGFHYDLMGPRVPTLLVSPLVQRNTVFRSPTDVDYDATSFLATLLHWFGVPKSRWGLGDRTAAAPTFEGALRRAKPRKKAPTFTPPYDQQYPQSGESTGAAPLHDLHRLMAPRLIWALTKGAMSAADAKRLSDDILGQATSVDDLARRIRDLGAQLE